METDELFGTDRPGPVPDLEAEAAVQDMVRAIVGNSVSNLRTLQEIQDGLSMDIPALYLGEKWKGGRKITIFDWMLAQDMLDYWAPGWQSYPRVVMSGERVTHTTLLCIPTSDRGIVCRGASGDDEEDDDEMPDFDLSTEEGQKAKKKYDGEQGHREYGSPTTRAEGQSFKRACARFGLGMHLRRKKQRYTGPVGAGSGRSQNAKVSAELPQTNQPKVPMQARSERPAPVSTLPTPPLPDRQVRFQTQWAQLKDWNWTKPQLMAQYEKIAGSDKFPDLGTAVQDHVIARFDELIAVEARNKRAEATRLAKAAETATVK